MPVTQPGFASPGAGDSEQGGQVVPRAGARPLESSPPDRSWIGVLLLAALGVGLIAAFFPSRLGFRRPALAGRGVSDPLFGPPDTLPPALDPEPQPQPRPAQRSTAAQPPPVPADLRGIVSTRLRARLELELVADRLVLTDEGALLHFECRVTNDASVPALDVRIEATMLNAGEQQDRELLELFERPAPAVAPVPHVPPLGEMALRSAVRLPHDRIREHLVEGRALFVPLIALNCFYRWSGGSGQTAASFLLGRGGAQDEKMAPFRTDLGPRIFRGLTQRRHTIARRD